jgi:signal transduction histidine kinase
MQEAQAIQTKTSMARVGKVKLHPERNMGPALLGSDFGLRNEQFLPDVGHPRLCVDNTMAMGVRQHAQTSPGSEVIEERNRLAREIHDTLAQAFAGILLQLEAVNRFEGAELQKVPEFLARARELAKCGLEDTRRMLLGLRPKSLEGTSLSEALRQLAEGFSRDCGINCAFSVRGRTNRLPEEIENELYRVAQEALCNVRKHSGAGSVSMVLGYRPGGVVLVIKDNGQGFTPTHSQPGAQGFGLPTMCDRANRLGGRMNINSSPGAGTELTMTVPLSGKTSMERSSQ